MTPGGEDDAIDHRPQLCYGISFTLKKCMVLGEEVARLQLGNVLTHQC